MRRRGRIMKEVGVWLRVVRRPAKPFSMATVTSPPVRMTNERTWRYMRRRFTVQPRDRAAAPTGTTGVSDSPADAQGRHRVQVLGQGVLIRRGDHMEHTDPGGAREQKVDRTHRTPPAARHAAGGVVELGGGAVDRDVYLEVAGAREPVGHRVVDEPARWC